MTKHCNKCDRDLPLDDFPRGTGSHGRHAYCKPCLRAYNAKRNHTAEGRARNREYKRRAMARPGVRERERERLKYSWLEQRHGLTRPQFEDLLSAQGGTCALCGGTVEKEREWHIDHDHGCWPSGRSCGRCRRGITCGPCNRGAGCLGDSYQRTFAATLYLMDYEMRKAGIEP